jgi:hypothetical protein
MCRLEAATTRGQNLAAPRRKYGFNSVASFNTDTIFSVMRLDCSLYITQVLPSSNASK